MIATTLAPAPVVDIDDQAGLLRAAFEGADLTPLIQTQLDRLRADPSDAGAFMTLGLLYQLIGQKENALTCQEAALHYRSIYRQPVKGAALRLLAIVAPGDLMTNTPVELLVERRPVEITRVYVDALGGLPGDLPEHDLAILAIGESDDTREMLQHLSGLSGRWPRPMVNDAGAVLGLARDRIWKTLEDIPGLLIPPTARIGREVLAEAELPQSEFPLIVRPVGSHAGQGLEKVDHPAELRAYLAEPGAPMVYVSRFIDYAGPDGRFRKYRIAFFDGRPFLAHMAAGDHWMVHYLNAGMADDPVKRAEEAQAMARFDQDFAARHSTAFAEMTRRLGLDYYAIDCAETPDGQLLIFEADISMIIHDLDSADLYPYKKPQMAKVKDGFEAMLRARAATAGKAN